MENKIPLKQRKKLGWNATIMRKRGTCSRKDKILRRRGRTTQTKNVVMPQQIECKNKSAISSLNNEFDLEDYDAENSVVAELTDTQYQQLTITPETGTELVGQNTRLDNADIPLLETRELSKKEITKIINKVYSVLRLKNYIR